MVFVTGAAHGQGRSHARHYARHGADVVVTDICENIETNPYDLGGPIVAAQVVPSVWDEISKRQSSA